LPWDVTESRIRPLKSKENLTVKQSTLGVLALGLILAVFASVADDQNRGAPTKTTVQQAQERLRLFGYDAGVADGLMGLRTVAALKRFQVDHGLPDSGVLDSRTLDVLNGPNTASKMGGQTSERADPKPAGGVMSAADTRASSSAPKPPVKKRFEDMTALEVAQDAAAYGFERGGGMVTTPTADGVREGFPASRDEQWIKKTPEGKLYILTVHYDKDGKLMAAKWGGF
jgi:peptidoglycan hydrolase-like protein with peptidoglycan-binding domain